MDVYDIIMPRLSVAWILKEEFFKDNFNMKCTY